MLIKQFDKKFLTKIGCIARYHGAVYPATGKKSSTHEEFDQLNQGEWQFKEVTKRLNSLKRDIMDALMDRQIASGLYSLADNPFQFTRDLQEMAKYYFGQSGKLIRPTISLLMSAACNQAKFSSSTSTSFCSRKPFSSSISSSSKVTLSSPSRSDTRTTTDSYQQELPQSSSSSISSLEPGTNEATSAESMEPAEISLNQYRIAMVAEMIHNSTLVHDDVIDESDTRRGLPTANSMWGNKQAVLVGDFILARATKVLCSIGQPPVIETMAQIVEDLVKGELMQLNTPARQSTSARFQHYMTKTFYKTGSLFANSCKSVAMLSGCDETAQNLATEFGRNLGLAFQLVDDVLDYVSSAAELGKPTAADLRLGLATCPVLFAAKEYPELDVLIERRFVQPGDIEHVLDLVHRSNGVHDSRQLASKHGEAAIQNVTQLLPHGGRIRDCLVSIVRRQLDRER